MRLVGGCYRHGRLVILYSGQWLDGKSASTSFRSLRIDQIVRIGQTMAFDAYFVDRPSERLPPGSADLLMGLKVEKKRARLMACPLLVSPYFASPLCMQTQPTVASGPTRGPIHQKILQCRQPKVREKKKKSQDGYCLVAVLGLIINHQSHSPGSHSSGCLTPVLHVKAGAWPVVCYLIREPSSCLVGGNETVFALSRHLGA